MDTTAIVALGKIAFTLGFMFFALYKGMQLWLALFGGGVLLGFLFGLGPLALGGVVINMAVDPAFLTMFLTVNCIMLLAEIQGKTGQGQRLALGLTPYIKSPRIRLIFFPALIGLLPVPGGAIFSCPLVRDVAHGFKVSNRKLVVINYWFRHVWESACPLYPGYILACAVGNIPPSILWRYTVPFVIFSIAVGWLILLREPIEPDPDAELSHVEKRPLLSVLSEALPLVVAIATAPLYSALFAALDLPLPKGASFIFSFLTASILALVQNKLSIGKGLTLMFSRNVWQMLLLVSVIFVFKETVIAANVVDAVATIITNPSAILVLFFILPVITGALTGMMMGFVGSCFPLLLGLLDQANVYDQRLCWILFSLACGHFGQMISPMHSCFLVTVTFFKERFSAVWHPLFITAASLLAVDSAYAAALYYFVTPRL